MNSSSRTGCMASVTPARMRNGPAQRHQIPGAIIDHDVGIVQARPDRRVTVFARQQRQEPRAIAHAPCRVDVERPQPRDVEQVVDLDQRVELLQRPRQRRRSRYMPNAAGHGRNHDHLRRRPRRLGIEQVLVTPRPEGHERPVQAIKVQTRPQLLGRVLGRLGRSAYSAACRIGAATATSAWNAWMPVCQRPRISAWMSWVPS